MSKEHHEIEQLTLDFESKQQVFVGKSGLGELTLVVNNTISPQPTTSMLKPNSPEITHIIRSLGKSLGW